MKQINLKEYYPFYTTDTIVEVPDEVADILRAYKLRDEAYRIYTYRHKAYFLWILEMELNMKPL